MSLARPRRPGAQSFKKIEANDGTPSCLPLPLSPLLARSSLGRPSSSLARSSSPSWTMSTRWSRRLAHELFRVAHIQSKHEFGAPPSGGLKHSIALSSTPLGLATRPWPLTCKACSSSASGSGRTARTTRESGDACRWVRPSPPPLSCRPTPACRASPLRTPPRSTSLPTKTGLQDLSLAAHWASWADSLPVLAAAIAPTW